MICERMATATASEEGGLKDFLGNRGGSPHTLTMELLYFCAEMNKCTNT